MVRSSGVVMLAVVGLLVSGCGGGGATPDGGGGGGTAHIKGVVVKGRVAGSSVTVYPLDAAGTRGASLGAGVSAADGSFDVVVKPYSGVLEVVAVGGVYTEEALGTSASLSGYDMSAVVAGYQAGSATAITVSPVSTVAAALARYHTGGGVTLPDALAEAYTHLNAHFGGVDWRTVVPADLSSASVTTLTLEARAGLVLAGLSQVAYAYATEGGVTPGAAVSAATLAAALASDAAAGGTLDGVGTLGVLRQGGVALDGQTVRRKLGQAVLAFLGSARNGSAIRVADGQAFATDLAGNSDPYLFCPNQIASAGCAGGSIDLDGPVATFVRPLAGAGVQGASVPVDVTAVDASNIASLQFVAPAGLTGTAVLTGTTATLSGVMDVSSMADGPLAVTVRAKDEFGNSRDTTVNVVVANLAPTISVGSPGNGGRVSGTVAVQATASPRTPGATITSLTVTGPAGLGVDTDATAAGLVVQWNTTLSLEGAVPLTFRAVDSYGSSSEVTVLPVVDNVPLGKVTAYVSAGSAVQNAEITVYALDSATGDVKTTVGASGVLGTGGATNASGMYVLTLSAENYAGPIQVVAKGPAGTPLTYVDPSDGTSPITIPTGLPLTTIIPYYETGAAITVPVTLWTTLADAELKAYVAGAHRLHPVPHTVEEASTFGDRLFAGHMDPTSPAPFDLRSIVPAVVTQPPARTLTSDVFAAFADVALNQLAREVGLYTGMGMAVSAPKLVQELQHDLAADGQFDGYKEGGVQVSFGSLTPYRFDNQTMRINLANALDNWIGNTSVNKTGLTRANLDTGAGVYDRIATDASDLFVGAGVSFDTTGPDLQTTVTYGAGLAPIGTAVAGTLHVVIAASDTSGVQGITVTRGGTSVVCPFATTSTTSGGCTFDFVTLGVADGPLSFVVTAQDGRGNRSTKTVSVTVDNTPPVISKTQPNAAAYYSDFVPVQASATDATGVASLVVTGLPGFVDADASASNLTGTWRTTGLAAPADQLVNAVFTACDTLGNCTAAAANTVAVTIDRTAPVVSFVSTPPSITSADTAVFVVAAADMAGVGKVWLSLDGAAAVQANTQGPNFTYTFGGVSAGVSHTVAVWAEDLAAPVNSGSGGASPQKITYSWIRDALGAAAFFEPSLLSYYDERGLKAGTTTSGGVTVAAMPLQPIYASGTKVGVAAAAGHVYRSMPRISSALTMTAAELETTNVDNVPVLQFRLPYNPGAEAAITSVKADVSYSGTGVSVTPDLGKDLLLSPKVEGGFVFYDLPLEGNLLPGLLKLTGATTVSVAISTMDAATNPWSSAGALVSFTFHPVGGVVVVGSDPGYAGQNKLESTYPYIKRQASPSYPELFTASASFQNGAVRIQRYVVTNPGSLPVAVAVAGLPAQWTMTESYSLVATGTTTSTACPIDVSESAPAAPDVVTGRASTMVLGVKISGGVEGAASDKTGTGEFIVPAASGGVAGQIVLYVGRAVVTSRTGAALAWNATAGRYEAGAAYGTRLGGNVATRCCVAWDVNDVCLGTTQNITVYTDSYAVVLTNGQDNAGSTFNVGTYGVTATTRTGEGNANGLTYAVPVVNH